MYQTTQTSVIPDTADQPITVCTLQLTRLTTAAIADGKFSYLHISWPQTLRVKNCPKFFDLYAGIYGMSVLVLFAEIHKVIWQAIMTSMTAGYWQMVNIQTIYCI